ncbi:hypothetical protein WOLCODRAFT_109578 [Wolfiporia cocos MD-104 SS10]|uniref:Uncharacterized protein n=1 Tax=Wolfiporia cocos (strain MD-104) TaxID=742152 RepID=A0A2H3J577_WOLCO|nr:hypothetical protein WOLCODRAFT_109578 [Wolfiporia cocos MD-104 SS10]
MSGTSLISASIASICIESFLYGIFFVLSIASMYLTVRRREYLVNAPTSIRAVRQVAHITPMSVAAICLFMTNTAHWIIDVFRTFQAYLNFDGGTEPLEYLSNASDPTEVAQTALVMVSLIIGDAMIIYRLWIIWSYNHVVTMFPSGTLVGLAVCAVGVIYQLTQSERGEDIFVTSTGRWITANCIFTLCTNIYSTAMISWRIWRVNKEAKRYGGSSLMGVLGIMVESAALYTAWTIFFFVTYEIRSNLQYLCSEAYCAIAGIAFMLINVRIGMGWAQRAYKEADTTTGIVLTSPGREQPDGYPMHRLAVNITRVVQQDGGADTPTKLTSHSSMDLSALPSRYDTSSVV